jgi:hypothetical protein
MQNTHWTNREDEILVDLARKARKLEHACEKASVIVNRSVNGCYQRLYTIRKNGTFDTIAKRLDKRMIKPIQQPQITLPVKPVEVEAVTANSYEAPQEAAAPNKIEVDVKYMSISNGKLIIHL